MWKKNKIAISVIILVLGVVLGQSVKAVDPVEQLQQEIEELEKLKQMSQAATAPLEQEVKSLATRINNAKSGLQKVKTQMEELAESIAWRSEQQAEQTQILGEVVAESYKSSQLTSPLLILLNQKQNQEVLWQVFSYQLAQKKNQEQIQEIITDIKQLNADKVELEETQGRLAVLEKQLTEQTAFFQKEIEGAKKYQEELSGKIAALTARQQEIINARSGTSITSVGEVPAADDPKASISWKEQAPSNSFAIFSFGAYTHRNGMSQYGAKARADAGQNAEEILKAYYPDATLKKDYGSMEEIEVQGHGRMSFEGTYLQSIYEVPASWPLEVLKAQAVAARTYAIKYTSNGSRSICTTEACQVYKNGKKGGEWEKAVNETRGWVLVDGGGNPISTQYASTHGGYANTSGYDTTDKSGEGNWTERAWEVKAGSPWFYKAWYRSGYSSSGDSCGRDHPWINQEEMADIINAWLVRKNPNGADSGRIQPVTINKCQIGGSGGNPYSMEEMKNLAQNSGGAVTRIDGVVVSHGNNGQTAQVKFSTNRGEITISGSEFKQIFNLRAPGYLRIPQSSFASFNLEFKR